MDSNADIKTEIFAFFEVMHPFCLQIASLTIRKSENGIKFPLILGIKVR